jgi:hypothetical protein
MKLFSLLDTQFHNFETSVKNYLAKQLNKANVSFGNSSVFGQMINVLSGVVQNIMLYIEDSLVEQNKYTAQRKKSIYGLAALAGYQPSLGKAAGVQLKLNYVPANVQGLNIIINDKQRVVCTQNGLYYNIILPQEAIVLNIAKDNSARYLYAVQGRFESQSFASTGGKLYTQNFKFNGHLDTDYIEVRINNKKWEKVESLYDMGPNAEQYTYRVNPFGGVDLIFGNDVHGKSLMDGDLISVTYLIHDGELGNVDITSDTYFVFDDSLYDVSGATLDGNSLFNVTFATQDSVTSGSNSESTEQVRLMIGFNSRSLVLADPKNYKRFINNFSFCGYNRTWSEPGSLIINSLILKNYKLNMNEGKDYFSLIDSDFILNDFQKSSIINAITESGNQLAGTTYNIIDPEICKYSAHIYVKLKSTKFDKEFIKNQIYQLMGDFFANVESDYFIPKSDIIALIKNNIDAVDGVDVYFMSERNEKALIEGSYKNTKYTYNPSKGTYDKKVEHITVYPGENPNIGLDDHGNILLQSDEQFPVLMGGWSWKNSENNIIYSVTDPLNIIFE